MLQACRIPTQCMSTSLAKRFPLPSYTRQCATCTCTHSLALEYTVPLNVYRKDSRHCTSCLKSADSLALCRCCWRGCRVFSMRRRKNLPPRIAWHAQFSEPTKLCSCCLLARLRALKCWSCWRLSLPLLTPRKVSGVGSAPPPFSN